MFGRTFSFWHRLVGKSPTPAKDPQAERRLWVRYPANLTANIQSMAGVNVENRVSAKVRDISLGGANLLVDREFQAGQLLTLELPQTGAGDVHTVLACVVRASAEGAGQWVLGCVFSRELTDDDMEGFGALRVRPPSSDQRTWMRFATKHHAQYQKIGDPDNRTHPAQVINVSASGIGLSVTDNVEAGALLSVDLLGPEGAVVRTILACVVHVNAQATGSLALGCNFIRELGEEEFKALV